MAMSEPQRDEASVWRVVSEKPLHESRWLTLSLADVELPDGRHIDHRVVRYPAPTAGLLLHDTDKNTVLLIWRHRFITDHWGWEVPAGLADANEDPRDAAIRECAEEAGYQAEDLKLILTMDTSSGISDEQFYGFYAQHATPVAVSDPVEASTISWVPVSHLTALINDGSVKHAHSLATLLMALQLGLLASED
jgi:8-oxo-dGTP pyrophosphatase MutT (NUDIX family)